MSKQKYLVAVDLDGVLWDLINPWVKRYNEITKENVLVENIKSYQISKYVEHPGILWYLLEMSDFWEKVFPYDYTAEAIQKLQSRDDIELVVLTNTSYKTVHHKFKRLFKVLPMLKCEDIIIAEKKNLIGADYLIDDYENNLSNLRFGKGILITQSYNKSFPNNTYKIPRCENILDAVNWVIKDIDKKELERNAKIDSLAKIKTGTRKGK